MAIKKIKEKNREFSVFIIIIVIAGFAVFLLIIFQLYSQVLALQTQVYNLNESVEYQKGAGISAVHQEISSVRQRLQNTEEHLKNITTEPVDNMYINTMYGFQFINPSILGTPSGLIDNGADIRFGPLQQYADQLLPRYRLRVMPGKTIADYKKQTIEALAQCSPSLDCEPVTVDVEDEAAVNAFFQNKKYGTVDAGRYLYGSSCLKPTIFFVNADGSVLYEMQEQCVLDDEPYKGLDAVMQTFHFVE